MKRRVPYTWKVGVDNAFGYLVRPGDGQHLAESRRFVSDRGRSTGLAVSLETGCTLLTIADGACTWQPVKPERACELAGIPMPEVDGEAETSRRLDPFHVERHVSPLFGAIVSLCHDHRLPCAHALRAWRQGAWDATFQGGFLEQPETFAACVLERIAATGQVAVAAIFTQLACDAGLKPDSPEHRELLDATGWLPAIAELEGRTADRAQALDAARQNCRQLASEERPQLSLL